MACTFTISFCTKRDDFLFPKKSKLSKKQDSFMYDGYDKVLTMGVVES